MNNEIIQKLRDNAERMSYVLERNRDILIKKTKDGSVKFLYYTPRNLDNFNTEED